MMILSFAQQNWRVLIPSIAFSLFAGVSVGLLIAAPPMQSCQLTSEVPKAPAAPANVVVQRPEPQAARLQPQKTFNELLDSMPSNFCRTYANFYIRGVYKDAESEKRARLMETQQPASVERCRPYLKG